MPVRVCDRLQVLEEERLFGCVHVVSLYLSPCRKMLQPFRFQLPAPSSLQLPVSSCIQLANSHYNSVLATDDVRLLRKSVWAEGWNLLRPVRSTCCLTSYMNEPTAFIINRPCLSQTARSNSVRPWYRNPK